jgi:hypothetical protein
MAMTAAYAAYRRLKHDVFVDEQGWRDPGDGREPGLASVDPYDRHGRFWLATSAGGRPIGAVRGVHLQDGFPRAELFARHRRLLEDGGRRCRLATINALAVVPAHRGREHRVAGRAWTGTVGRLLTLALMAQLEAEGAEGVIATAGGGISLRMFGSLGFTILDRPGVTALNPRLAMTNIGLAFDAPAAARARQRHGFGQGRLDATGAPPSGLWAYLETCVVRGLPRETSLAGEECPGPRQLALASPSRRRGW